MYMKNIEKLLEIEALTENITKHFAENNLLRMKILYFISVCYLERVTFEKDRTLYRERRNTGGKLLLLWTASCIKSEPR